jgi:hypothetical protein
MERPYSGVDAVGFAPPASPHGGSRLVNDRGQGVERCGSQVYEVGLIDCDGRDKLR